MTIYSPPIQRDPSHSLERLTTPFWDAIGAAADDAFYLNPVSAIGRILGLEAERLDLTDELVPAEELNERYGALGLNFRRPERMGAVAVIVRRKQEEIARRDALARASQDLGTQGALFLTGLAVSMADPINVASSFVPIVRASRMASWTARMGVTRARVARGAVEGAVGATLVEPIVLAAALHDQSQYGLLDSLLNVTFGTILGGGLHAGFGKVSDYLGRTKFEAREGALRAAIAQTAEGRPVDVAPILRTDPRFAGGEARFDPSDPRFIPELNDPVRPPPARGFDRGPALGLGKAESFPNYSRINAQDMRFIQAAVEDLEESFTGHRVFQDNPFGPGQEIIGVKGTTPHWFQNINEEAVRNRRERRKALKKARREGRADDIKGGDFGPETILTREKVRATFDKLKAREPLGREEIEIAEILFDVGRRDRERYVDEILDYRQQRAEESRAELEAFAEREMQDAEGRLDPGDEDAPAVREAEEAAAVAAKQSEDVRPDAEGLDEELEFLNGEIEALRRQGALTDEDIAAGRFEDEDISGETVKAHGDAAEAAARCLLIHP